MVGNFALLFNCTPLGQITYSLTQFLLKDLSTDERVRAWCCVCSPAHWGLSVGFLLHVCLFVLFDLVLYIASTIFQLNRDGSSWVGPILS